MSSIPRVILTICDSYHGGFNATKPTVLSPGIPEGPIRNGFICKRWLNNSDRFSFTNPFNSEGTYGPWEILTDTQNASRRGATMSYGVIANDFQRKVTRQPRYNIFLSGSATTAGYSGGAVALGVGNRPLNTWSAQASDGMLDLYIKHYLRPSLRLIRRPFEFGGLYFSLGANDAKTGTGDEDLANDESYLDDMTRILSAIETELGITEIPAVGNAVPGDLDTDVYVSRDTLRAQQRAIASINAGPLTNVKFYDATGSDTVDGIHLTHEAAIKVGIAMNEQLLVLNPIGSEPIIN